MAHIKRFGWTVLFLTLLTFPLPEARAESTVAPAPLLAVDQHRATIVDGILRKWHDELVLGFGADAPAREASLRDTLLALRADRLLSASLAEGPAGIALALGEPLAQPGAEAKALGDPGSDVTYVPVTPCRLVDTRGPYSAVYKGGGAFIPNQIRSYTVHGGNGVCLTQLPASLNPAAVQMQVFGMPTTGASGDLEILPQGSAFGSTVTMVYMGTLAFNTVSTATRVNLANDQISVQVRGGGAHVAIDVVGYYAAPSGTGGQFFRQGGNAFGAGAKIGTLDNQPVDVLVNNQRVFHAEPTAYTPNIVNGYAGNGIYANLIGVTIAGGGAVGVMGALPPTTEDVGCSLGYGCINGVLDSFGTIGGGVGNLAGAGVVGIGFPFATVAGGVSNWAYGESSTVAGGFTNVASGLAASVGGGGLNQATGSFATVPGGYGNIASGAASFAAGYRASATGDSQFTWSDDLVLRFDPGAMAQGWINPANTFNVRATGGIWFVSGATPLGSPTAWCSMQPGSAAWGCTSSRDAKTQFAPVDTDDVLRKVVAMPVETWRFKSEDEAIRHLGPMAQDFYAAFHLGHDPRAITTTDAAGVALAAIQGLYRLIEARDARIEALERGIEALRARVVRLHQP